MATADSPSVSPELERRIIEEERMRLRIRNELAVREQTPSKPLTLWTFLNSQFGLFLLGAIFVSGLGGAFTYFHQWRQDKASKVQNARKLLSEFDFRLNDLDTRVSQINAAQDLDSKGAIGMYVWRAARGDSAFQPALPEYKNVHWAGVIIQIDALGFGANSSAAVQATRDLENGGAIPTPHGYAAFKPGYLEDRSKILHEFSATSWREVDSHHRQYTSN
jgi:hypothetical protein